MASICDGCSTSSVFTCFLFFTYSSQEECRSRPNNSIVRFCRMQDVGKPKAEVAAQRVMQRVKGVTVVPHFCRIEEKDITFYQDFQIIVLGLDSLEARSYINSVVCGFLGLILQPSACISKFRCCKFNLNLLRLCHPFHLSQLKLLEISACSSGLFQVGDTKYAFYLNCCGIMSTIWCF